MSQEKYAEAGRVLKRSLTIEEKALGTSHPDVVSSLGLLAQVFRCMGSKKKPPNWRNVHRGLDPNQAIR